MPKEFLKKIFLTKEKHALFLAFILFIAFLLRFWQLGSVPVSLNWDEVSWGYNAYSVLQTGKDEHGNSFPMSFKAFGDYKQPVYVYLSVMPIKFFGLTSEAIRIPSAILGSLSVLLVFLFVKELFRREEDAGRIATASAFLFAISPWSIQFSRVAYEANVGLFFVLLGAYVFLKGVNLKNSMLIFFSTLVLGISAFTYHSLKIFTPLLVLFLSFYSIKYLNMKKIVILIFLVVYASLNLLWVIDSRTTARGRSVTFISNPQKILEKPAQELISDIDSGDKLGMLIHNRRVVYLQTYVENYLSHFNPVYLFVTGDNPRHHAPGMGLIYVISLPFILIGIYTGIRDRRVPFSILLAWFFLAPVASSLSQEVPNASRSLIFLPTWQIFSALGWIYVFDSVLRKKNILNMTIKGILVFLLVVNIIYFVHQYFKHTNSETLYDWQYGYKEAVQYAGVLPANQRAIFSSDVEQAYIFYLFYNKISPKKYINEGGSSGNNSKCFLIENSLFGNCQNEIKVGDVFITSSKIDYVNNHQLFRIKTISYENKQPAVFIYKVI